ncbi:MAG: hypothetical protein ACREKS_07155 [Candidatus Rokuibacteriota bacterium]
MLRAARHLRSGVRGTLASWGCDLLNLLTGDLDRPGGVMFPTPAAPITALGRSRPFELGRWQSRVGARPEARARIPSSTMPEEMLTSGEGQVRAMILLMTNPLPSAANSGRLEAAFAPRPRILVRAARKRARDRERARAKGRLEFPAARAVGGNRDASIGCAITQPQLSWEATA